MKDEKPLSPASPDDGHVAGRLLSLGDVATRLRVSTRHVRRLADAGRIPAPIHIGRLLRWRSEQLSTWIDAGCPVIRNQKGRTHV